MVSILSPLSFLFQYTRKQRLLLSYILRFCGHIRNTRRSSACSDGTPNSSFWPMAHATVLAASHLQTTHLQFTTERQLVELSHALEAEQLATKVKIVQRSTYFALGASGTSSAWSARWHGMRKNMLW